jgi:polysaccharide biosynthesis/export protein
MRKIPFFFILLLPGLLIGQDETTEEKNQFLTNKATDDSRAVQYYYQKFLSTQSADQGEAGQNLTGLSPTFGLDKESLLDELKKAMPLEGPVDPKQYFLGPNDILSINVWGRIPFEYKIAISPEGTLLVPNFGVIDVKGRTLQEIKTIVPQALGRTFIQGSITVTLLKSRIFMVHVGGVVDNPGSFFASATQRVDHAIYLANLQKGFIAERISQVQAQRLQQLNQTYGLQYFGDNDPTKQNLIPSLRNILLIRNNGDTALVDLASYYASGDLSRNPYLNDGDRIIVPNLNLNGNSVSISGEVRLEGIYEYQKSDSLRNLLQLAQGATSEADLTNISIYRWKESDRIYSRECVNLQDILQGKASDVALLPDDKIVIPSTLPRKRKDYVTLKGEVRRPGVYPVSDGRTTLEDLIELAGGFTEEASLKEARIIRKPEMTDKALENPDYYRMAMLRLSQLDEQEREYFNFEAAIQRHFVNVDFEKVFISRDSTRDVPLQGGDIVLVPRKSNSVFVFGQVQNPGYIEYVPGKKTSYYVKMAGGTTQMTNSYKIKIIKSGSFNWITPDQSRIQPGDSIYVPRKKEKSFFQNLSRFSTIISLTASILTVIVMLRQQ